MALVQEDVDTMEDKKWECPECASLRNERRMMAQERARLKRAAQGKAVIRQASYSFMLEVFGSRSSLWQAGISPLHAANVLYKAELTALYGMNAEDHQAAMSCQCQPA